jgi:hypothetical protein
MEKISREKMKHFEHILAEWLFDGSGGPMRRNAIMSWKEGTIISIKEVTDSGSSGVNHGEALSEKIRLMNAARD